MERRTIYDGKVVKLGIEPVELPDGNIFDLEVVRHVGAAAVLPLTEDGQVILVRQFRHATGGWLLEAPAGKKDPGESPEMCAMRETEEEVGYRPGQLLPMGWIWTTPGFCDEQIWLYLATDLQPGSQALEHDEHLSLVKMPLEEAVEMAISGEIVDAKTVCLLLRCSRFNPSS